MRAAVVSLLVLWAGCSKPAPAPAAPGPTRLCTVTVALKATDPAARAAGAGESSEAATESAWAAACAALPVVDAPACRDGRVFSPGVVTVTRVTEGVRSYSSTVSLRRLGPRAVASAEDCRDAEGAACEKAGTARDCIATGTHVVVKIQPK